MLDDNDDWEPMNQWKQITLDYMKDQYNFNMFKVLSYPGIRPNFRSCEAILILTLYQIHKVKGKNVCSN